MILFVGTYKFAKAHADEHGIAYRDIVLAANVERLARNVEVGKPIEVVWQPGYETTTQREKMAVQYAAVINAAADEGES